MQTDRPTPIDLEQHRDSEGNAGFETHDRPSKQMGRSKEAAPHFRSAASIAPVEVYFANLGQALWSTGEIEEAMRALRTAVRMNPTGQVRRWTKCFGAYSAGGDRGRGKKDPAQPLSAVP
jgi:tetratricopeptide (TPR) repeat protein